MRLMAPLPACCAPSATTTPRAQGLLTVEGRRTISTLIFNIFVPCLFFYNLGVGMSLADAARLWPLTVNMILG